jgi:hypothetical protein
MIRALTLCAALAGCVAAPVVTDRGCASYIIQRAGMPPLGDDARSWWIAVTDTAMTETCR